MNASSWMHESLPARLVRYGWYPFVLIASVGLAFALISSGTSPGVVVAIVGLGLIPLSLALELAFPETPRWRLERGEVFTDFLHMMLSNPIPTQIFKVLFYGAIVSASAAISEAVGLGLWPVAWPLAAQALLALVIAELVNYWIHRGYHESRLWPLHAVHHCSPRMYFFLSVRKHPIQTVLTFGGRLSVLWLLGVTEPALAIYTVFVGANSYAQHANVRMTTGPLRYLLATPELHRIHHSRRIAEHNTNYGDSLSIWDRLFGTYTEPDPARELHGSIGLPDVEVPQTYWAHLALPFRWRRLHAGLGEAATPPAAPSSPSPSSH